MIRRFPFAIIMTLVTAAWLIGCIQPPIINGDPGDSNGEHVTGEIIMHQTGGFAGFSRTTKIAEVNGSIILSFTDHVFNQHKEVTVAEEDVEKLWQTLEDNDVYTLPTNHKMLETVADAFFFEIIVQRGEKHNQFSVYAQDLLFLETGEKRYDTLVKAINDFSDLRLQNAEDFIISQMPVTGISFQILESFPLQVHVMVEGYLSDACTVVNETTQRRDGATVYVNITTKRPADLVCIQVIDEITLRVPLDGTFFPGRYKVIVNDFEKDLIIEGPGFVEEPSILQGTVTIGPLCPVEPCDLPPEQIAAIYMARKVIVYEQRTETKVTEANLGKDGKYSFDLDPGVYTVDVSDAGGNALPLDPAERPRIGNATPQEVEIRAGEIFVVDFDIDTGIR